MCKRNNSSLFFTCSLIECIGRKLKQRRSAVVAAMGRKEVERVYQYADVLHCEPLEKVAEDTIEDCKLQPGSFDNVKDCRYAVPDVWTIGKVYARLIEDLSDEDNVIETLFAVYGSWLNDVLSDYNEVAYFQPREYLAESFRAGDLLEA